MRTRSLTTRTVAAVTGAIALVLASASGAQTQTPDPSAAPGVQERMERMRDLRAERMGRLQELQQQRAAAPLGIERILEQRARLGLTDPQVTALNTLRVQTLELRQARAANTARVQSDLAAGEITRAEAAARLDQFRSEGEAGNLQTRIREILTEEQLTRLQDGRRATLGRGEMRRAPMPPGLRGTQDRRAPRGWRMR